MRKSLKKLKEEEQLPEPEKPVKKTRKRRIKEREPNVVGGAFFIVTLVILFFAIRAFGSDESAVKGVKKSAEETSIKRQEEKAQALENVKSELEQTSTTVKENIESISVAESALESVDKVSRDIDAAQDLPAKTTETVKNMKIGEAVSLVGESLARLSKVYTDVKSVQEKVVDQLRKL